MSKKLIIIIGLFVIFVCMILWIIFGNQGLNDLTSLEKEKEALLEINLKTAAENRLLGRIINRLNTDSVFIEELARQELGMIGKNEIVFQFSDKNKSVTNDK